MKVLVTGGGGFLGSWICRQLKNRGDEPVAFQRSDSSLLRNLGIEVRQGNLLDLQAVIDAATGCEAVIHTAGKAGAWGAYEDYYAVNVTGTENVLSACAQASINKLVYTSSPSVAHGGGDIEGGDESLPYPDHYEAPYPETKARGEQLVMAADNPSLRTVSIRPHLVWGPGDNQLLPRLVEKAAGGVLKLPGPGKLIDTVYVENAARSHLLALDAINTNPACHGKTYFISNDDPRTQADIISRLLAAVGMEVEIRAVPARVASLVGSACETIWKLTGKSSEPPITKWSAEQLSTAHWYDISAAKRDLGYEATISIEEGLERLGKGS